MINECASHHSFYMTISRQRRWQIKKKNEEKCEKCGGKLYFYFTQKGKLKKSTRCMKCNEYQRKINNSNTQYKSKIIIEVKD